MYGQILVEWEQCGMPSFVQRLDCWLFGKDNGWHSGRMMVTPSIEMLRRDKRGIIILGDQIFLKKLWPQHCLLTDGFCHYGTTRILNPSKLSPVLAQNLSAYTVVSSSPYFTYGVLLILMDHSH